MTVDTLPAQAPSTDFDTPDVVVSSVESTSPEKAPVSNEAVTISFKQQIKATDALRTGAYSKTLTFTLSTTTP